MKISDTDKIHVALGGLEFEVLSRDLEEIPGSDDDGGLSIEVFGEVAGTRTQVLRFDVFRGSPHYHAPPSAPGQIPLDPQRDGDPLEWSLTQIRDGLPELLERAGFADLAGKVDRDALRAGARRVREAAARSAVAPKRSREL